MAEMYMDRLKVDLAKYLGLPEGNRIVGIDQESTYRQGCLTCGGTYEFRVNVCYVDENGKRIYKSYDGDLVDFLRDIPLGV